jgi:hypothetical protein
LGNGFLNAILIQDGLSKGRKGGLSKSCRGMNKPLFSVLCRGKSLTPPEKNLRSCKGIPLVIILKDSRIRRYSFLMMLSAHISDNVSDSGWLFQWLQRMYKSNYSKNKAETYLASEGFLRIAFIERLRKKKSWFSFISLW